MLKWLWLSVLMMVLDQASKWYMASWLTLHDTIAVMPYVNLTMAHNTGAAFSFLANGDGWQRWFFIVVAVVISIVLVVWLAKLKPNAKLEAVSISLILGGAVGNVIDRIIHGYVIDFIDLYYKASHWPAFNIADSAICIGAVLLLIDSFTSRSKGELS